MLATKVELIRHGKSSGSRCDRVFVNKLDWMIGDSTGSKKNLMCPNPRCKVIVGIQSESGLICSCGFEDNPAYTLFLASIRPYTDQPIIPIQRTQPSTLNSLPQYTNEVLRE